MEDQKSKLDFSNYNPREINDGWLLSSPENEKMDFLKSISSTFGCVLVDEAHLFVPKKSREVIETFNSKFRYGFTATPKRTDEQSEAIFFLFGPIRVKRELPSATPKVKLIPFYGEIPILEYAKIIDYQSTNSERNNLICKLVLLEASRGRRVLVLTKRIGHFEEVYRLLRERNTDPPSQIFKLRSDEDNRHLLQELRSNTKTFKVLLGTYSLLSTGVDIPSLDTLILAGDLKSEVLTEQSGGRIRRLFEGKQEPLIIDMQDMGNKILALQAKARLKFYKSANWQII
jgi:superfamily II DNA or RNA helicase